MSYEKQVGHLMDSARELVSKLQDTDNPDVRRLRDRVDTYISERTVSALIACKDQSRSTASPARCSSMFTIIPGWLSSRPPLWLGPWDISLVEPVGRGTFAFTLSSGACLHSSASYRDTILRILPMRRFSGRRVAR